MNDTNFVNPLFSDTMAQTLFHRKIWLTLGCPRIDDLGGKIHRELQLDSRLYEFKKNFLLATIAENIFKAHQSMIAYGRNELEYQALNIEQPP